MSKEPIEVLPTDRVAQMDPASRIHFGKTYSVKRSVKAKDIGKVIPKHIPKMLQYWEAEEHNRPTLVGIAL